MRVLLAGATGVIGRRLVPLLVDAGHEVLGLTRRREGVRSLRGLGADGRICDVFDAQHLTEVAVAFSPELVIHQLTDLSDDPRDIDDRANARMRTEGTDNLIAAARTAGAARFIAQSIAWDLPGVGGEAVAYLEDAVLRIGGGVIRYGRLYGPGTYYPTSLPDPPRIHVDQAASRTMLLLDAPSEVVELTDD